MLVARLIRGVPSRAIMSLGRCDERMRSVMEVNFEDGLRDDGELLQFDVSCHMNGLQVLVVWFQSYSMGSKAGALE
jgi:hypothetical protein